MDNLATVAGWIWQYGIIFLLVLTLVVFIHELGHFLVARWCGVTVKAFSIGFGPEIFGFDDKHGTRWRFAWIPLGGYVKFVDDENAASKPSPEALSRMSAAERKGSFHAKPVSQRAAVVAAGPIANFLLAIALYAGLNWVVGVREMPAVIDAVLPGTPAAKAGFLPGDKIIAIDGSKIDSLADAQGAIDMAGGREMTFAIERQGDQITLGATPDVQKIKDQFGRALTTSDIGFRSLVPARVGELQADLPAFKAGIKVGDLITSIDGVAVKSFDEVPPLLKTVTSPVNITLDREGSLVTVQVVPVMKSVKDAGGNETVRPIIGITRALPPPRPVTLFEAMVRGVKETYGNITQSLAGLKAIIGQRQSAEQLGGPVLMAEVTAKVAELGWEPMLRWIAFISANIGFLNLLPVPVLDGGHLLFYTYEAVVRKPVSDRMQQFGFQVGIALLMMLMIFVNFNDLLNVWRRLTGAG